MLDIEKYNFFMRITSCLLADLSIYIWSYEITHTRLSLTKLNGFANTYGL